MPRHMFPNPEWRHQTTLHLILLLSWQNNSVRPNGRFLGSRAFGIESHVLTPEESKEIYPLLDANNFYASLYR